MSNPKKIITDLNKDADALTSMLVVETCKMIDAQPESVKTQIYFSFLAKFIGAIIYRSLKSQPDKHMPSQEEIYEYVSKNYSNAKTCAESAIAAAFTGAMSTFSAKEVEYYCLIRPVPPVANKEPC